MGEMKLKQQLLHSVNGSGKIKLSREAMAEAGLVPGERIEIVVEKGLLKIRPLS
jgi:hypothetical protein